MIRGCLLLSLTLSAQIVSASETEDTVQVRQLDEVVVTATGAERNLKSTEMGRHLLSEKAIIRMPVMFGEPDIVKTLQTLPGVSQGVEGFTGLYVHGGDNDQNLFLYNGLPLYHVSHLGGIFSSFNVATVKSVDFYKSSFPSRYGDRISSITNVEMKTPNFSRYTGRVSLGLLAANVYISGPIIKDKLAFSSGIRRSWIDVVGLPALAIVNAAQKKNGKKTIAGYSFTDFNVRLDYRFNAGALYMIGYYGHDRLKIGERLFEPDLEVYPIYSGRGDTFASETVIDFFDENVNRMSWGNWGISANLDMMLGSGHLNAIVYHTSYSSCYKQEWEFQSDMSDPDTYGYVLNKTDNAIADFGVKGAYIIGFGNTYKLIGGAGYINHNYHPEGIENIYKRRDMNRHDSNSNPKVKSNEVFAFVDNDLNLGEILSLNVGLRYVMHTVEGRNYSCLEPRAAFRVNLTKALSVKGSYARMNQFVQQVSNNYVNLPTDLWQPISSCFEPLQSDNYSVGVYGNIPLGMYFSVEGWYKNMDNLLEYREGVSTLNPDICWEDKLTSGKGWAYGFDLNITRETGRLTGSVGYGLMWNWREFDELNGGAKFPAKFDNRHKFNVNLSYKLNDNVEFNAGWTFMTGNRMTLSLYNYDETGDMFPDAPTEGIGTSGLDWEQSSGLGYISERNNIRLPAYHRLDLGVSIYKNMKKGRRGIWSFGLYNAYCYMNTLTITKEDYLDDSTPTRTFKKLSLIPIIPSVSYIYEF